MFCGEIKIQDSDLESTSLLLNHQSMRLVKFKIILIDKVNEARRSQ